MVSRVSAYGLVALLGLAGAASAQQPVSGVVRYQGAEIKLAQIRMDADPKCVEVQGQSRVSAQDRLIGATGGVQNAFVYLKAAPAGTPSVPPSQPVVLDQRGCLYSPRVLGLQVGQTLQIENSDPTLHNVRFLAQLNRPFNIGQPPDQPPRQKTFELAEPAVKFKCDVHPWMAAHLFVMDHPYFAVSGSDGAFTLASVPAGKQTLVAWHEAFGEQELEIEVGNQPLAGISFTFE